MNDAGPEPLPELQDAVLQEDELFALFRDYRSLTEIQEILVKMGRGHAPPGPQPTLDEVEKLLNSRAVRGIQIRYAFNSANWCDTLMPTPNGIRLIRVQQLV